MSLRDLGYALQDFGRVGLVMAKRAAAGWWADERSVTPGMVSELVGRLHPERIDVRVVDIIPETHSTRTIRLAPVGEGFLPPFRAGQFVALFLDIGGVRTSRPYSISSSPTQTGFIDITVRRMTPGFVSEFLNEHIAVGDRLQISGPAGSFCYEPLVDTDDLVFLAGGCGITPFMSMIQHAADIRADITMHLIYGNRTAGDVIFKDRLEALASSLRSLRMDIVISEPEDGYQGRTGLLDTKCIRECVADLRGKTFFVCGPHAMYDVCLQALRDLGVPERRIKRELSGPLPDVTRAEGWPQEIDRGRRFTARVESHGMPARAFEVASTEPLLVALERNGLIVDSLCRSGECGVCRVLLLEGKVFMPETVALRKADALFGYIHACMAYPLSDVRIRL